MTTDWDIGEIADELADVEDIDVEHHVKRDELTFVVRITPDDMSIMDEQGEGVWCGRIEWGTTDPDFHRRPSDFTGRAERLHVNEYHSRPDLWWEVPEDVEIGSEGYASLRQCITGLLENGYVGIMVKVRHERPDGYTREWTADLWGNPWSLDRSDRREIISDLLDDIHQQMEES